MIRSMTGYGRGKSEADGREYTVEIKTINHRYNDISIKMPRYLNFLEDKIRQCIMKYISRGKMEVFVTVKNISSASKNIMVDKALAGEYVTQMHELIEMYGLKDDISVSSLMRLPDIITNSDVEDEELYWNPIQEALKIAINSLISAKEVEGEKLKLDIESRLNVISEYVGIVQEKSADLLEEYKTKLNNRINELNANSIIDENRLGIEIVLFADKSSICEEVTRLKSHITSLKNMLEVSGPIGKKIDFLVQEMNRETNTIGSKANSVGITNYVVEMKNEIENIREQVQNIE
ncbi:MAG: YicC family protein [Clostridia bacterium]|nr:YicC family protein [Clostridia bacterium]